MNTSHGAMIEVAIANYIGHLGNAAYMASVVAKTDDQGLVDVLVKLIGSDDHEQVGQACLFIQDLILVAPKHSVGLSFRDGFHTSALIAELERAVLVDNYFIRNQAIYTLAKTGSTRSIPAQYRAFDVLLERDR
jgi:hypothetical protein